MSAGKKARPARDGSDWTVADAVLALAALRKSPVRWGWEYAMHSLAYAARTNRNLVRAQARRERARRPSARKRSEEEAWLRKQLDGLESRP